MQRYVCVRDSVYICERVDNGELMMIIIFFRTVSNDFRGHPSRDQQGTEQSFFRQPQSADRVDEPDVQLQVWVDVRGHQSDWARGL